MATQIYKVRDPTGAIREIRGPEGASDDEVIAQAKKLFTGGSSLVNQIPDTPATVAPTPAPGIMDRLAGIPEASAAIGTGAITGLVAPVYGLAKSVMSGKLGTPEGVQIGADAAAKVAGMGYQPRSQTGQALTNAFGEAVGSLIPAAPALNAMVPLAGPAARQAGQAVAPVVNALKNEADLARQPVVPPTPRDAVRTAAAPTIKAMGDLEQTPRLDAVKEGVRLGAVLHPSETGSANPGMAPTLAGPTGIRKVAETNAELPTRIVKADQGLDPGAVLNTATFDQLKAEAAKPYAPVREMKDFPNTEKADVQLQALRRDPLFGETVSNAHVIDAATNQLESGMSGARVLDSISQLRREANKTYANPTALPEAIRTADTKIALSKVLETLIDENVTDPKVLQGVRDARAKLAKIYADESVIDPKTLKVDPAKLATLATTNAAYSGDAAALGKVIGQFPKSFGDPFAPFGEGSIHPTFSRIGGVTGAVTSVGGKILDKVVRERAANYITRPEYQANKMRPPDRREVLNKFAQ